MKKQQYTMEDFRKGRVAVAIRNDRERDAFLRLCKRNGIKWCSGDLATEFYPKSHYPYAIVSAFWEEQALSWTDHMISAISLSQITGASAATHYQILIDCDDNKTTVARLLVNGREIKRREARCNLSDRFSLRKGAEIAFDRLWDKQVKPEKKHEVREVNRYAKVGEWIKIVRTVASGGQYHAGDILPVRRAREDGVVTVLGVTIPIIPSEYVVLEGYDPKRRCSNA